jgi:hypothetical protein
MEWWSRDSTMLSSIRDVKAKYEKRLLAMQGVVSVGIGRDPEGQSIIIVGLDGPRPKTVKKLPKQLDGYPVQVKIIGPVKAL